MKGFLRNISIALLCGALAVPVVSAQGRHGNGTNGGRSGRLEHTSGQNRGNHQSRSGSNRERPSINAGHNNKQPNQGTTGNGNNRPGNGNHGSSRPGINNVSPNHPNHGGNIGNNNHNPGNHPNQGNNTRPGINNNGQNKPGNGIGTTTPTTPPHGTRPAINNRPNNGGNPSNNRPGHNPAPNRPGIPSSSHQPGFGVGPHAPGRPGFRPGASPQVPRPPMMAPPARPHRPPMLRPPHRPMPPRGWRPAPRLPLVRGILGLTFGTAINLSLDYLFNAGYNVDGYTNDVVYLRNVSALNYIWTDAALYYGNAGLDASSFYYSTPGYDLARYNNVYNSLVATYGLPVSTTNSVNALSATWFGGNNGYITLSFGQNNLGSGLRFLTTLTFGL